MIGGGRYAENIETRLFSKQNELAQKIHSVACDN